MLSRQWWAGSVHGSPRWSEEEPSLKRTVLIHRFGSYAAFSSAHVHLRLSIALKTQRL